MNAFNDQEKQNPELNRHFQMYQSQLNFVNFCAKNALGISWQHLIHPNIHVCSVYAVDNTASLYVLQCILLPNMMVLLRLKLLTLKVHTTVNVMIMVSM